MSNTYKLVICSFSILCFFILYFELILNFCKYKLCINDEEIFSKLFIYLCILCLGVELIFICYGAGI